MVVGKIYDLESQTEKGLVEKELTEDQFKILDEVAHKWKDAEFNTVYKINELEFYIRPVLVVK